MIWKELTTGITLWDVRDTGIDTLRTNLYQEADCNTALLIARMHGKKRPDDD